MSSPNDILANVVRGWGRDPHAQLAGSSRTGISAALWSGGETRSVELQSDPDSARHIVCVQLTSFHAEMFVDGKPHYNLKHVAGSSSIVRAGESPRAVVQGAWNVLHIYLPTAVINDIADGEGIAMRASEIELICHKGTPDPIIRRISSEIIKESRLELPYSRLRIDLLGQDLAIHLLRRHSNFGRNDRMLRDPAACDWRVRRAIERLEAELADDTSLADLAAASEISPRHLTDLFRAATGVPPHQWLMRRRVERAQEMLDDARHSVTEIAHSCGFASSQHLATVFKRHVGVTPTEYRRERCT